MWEWKCYQEPSSRTETVSVRHLLLEPMIRDNFAICDIARGTRELTLMRTASASRYYAFTARNCSLVLNPRKPMFSFSLENENSFKRPASYSCPIPCHRYLATLAIWSFNMTACTREPTICAWIRGVAQIFRNLAHLSHIIESQDTWFMDLGVTFISEFSNISDKCRAKDILG